MVVAAGHRHHVGPCEAVVPVVHQVVIVVVEDRQHVRVHSERLVEALRHCVVVEAENSCNENLVVGHRVVDSDMVDIDRMVVVVVDELHTVADNRANGWVQLAPVHIGHMVHVVA